jgi:hypothetical protein
MMSKGYREKCLAQKISCCNVCGGNEKLHVHHINGDRDDNRLENLIPLCQNCHHKVHCEKEPPRKIKRLQDKLPDGSLRFSTTNRDADMTSIPIESEVRDDLRAAKQGGETYSDVISRLLNRNNE